MASPLLVDKFLAALRKRLRAYLAGNDERLGDHLCYEPRFAGSLAPTKNGRTP